MAAPYVFLDLDEELPEPVPRPLPRFDAQQKVADAQQVERILAQVETESTPLPVNGAGGGSSRRMRGVPIVGVRGAGGTSPGTDPSAALIYKEGQRRRR